MVRALADGTKFIYSTVGAFDLSLVLIGTLGVVTTHFINPIAEAEDVDLSTLKPILVLRILRLLRLVRALRMVALFEELWKIASGLMQCVGSMGSTVTLLTITLYIAACVAVEII